MLTLSVWEPKDHPGLAHFPRFAILTPNFCFSICIGRSQVSGRHVRSNLYFKNVSTTSSPVLSKFGNLEHIFISSGHKLQVFKSQKTVTLETRYIFNGFVTECHNQNMWSSCIWMRPILFFPFIILFYFIFDAGWLVVSLFWVLNWLSLFAGLPFFVQAGNGWSVCSTWHNCQQADHE